MGQNWSTIQKPCSSNLSSLLLLFVVVVLLFVFFVVAVIAAAAAAAAVVVVVWGRGGADFVCKKIIMKELVCV